MAHQNLHFSNEMPPDYDETDFITSLQDAIQNETGQQYNNFEVTNIKHHKGADGITYHARVLVDDGKWLIVYALKDTDGQGQLLQVIQNAHLNTAM